MKPYCKVEYNDLALNWVKNQRPTLLALQVISKAVYESSPSLRQAGMEFAVWTFKHGASDQLEKAAPDVLKGLLAQLEDGKASAGYCVTKHFSKMHYIVRHYFQISTIASPFLFYMFHYLRVRGSSSSGVDCLQQIDSSLCPRLKFDRPQNTLSANELCEQAESDLDINFFFHANHRRQQYPPSCWASQPWTVCSNLTFLCGFCRE